MQPRWPAAVVIAVVVWLLAALPEHVALTPAWFQFVMAAAILAPMGLAAASGGVRRWVVLERRLTLSLAGILLTQGVVTLAVVIREMLSRSGTLTGFELLASSVALWVGSAAMFALVYWQLDRGGPEGVRLGSANEPDWRFPRDGEALPGGGLWAPSFVDYLFLAFTTAVSFTPADAVPLTGRAKLLMMVQAMIALVTIVVVAARAIGELGP